MLLFLTGSCSLIFKEAPQDAGAGACTMDCPDGQECSDGQCACTPESCAAGCCGEDGECNVQSSESCGTMGGSCTACDEVRDDSCREGGVCGCGDGETCVEGQRCDRGSCVCDGESCPTGCCDEGMCMVNVDSACGIAGGECLDCSNDGGCQEGACGACVTSCTDGCCAGPECVQQGAEDGDPTTCGSITGGACIDCGIVADRCSGAGECECGPGGAVCASGQQCLNEVCQCTTASCAGCCDDVTKTCVPASTGDPMTCNGTAGDSCQDCGMSADTCSDAGVCECGGEPACDGGRICDEGTCVLPGGCTATTCPNGCCNAAGACVPVVLMDKDACGTGIDSFGDACVACAEACDNVAAICKCEQDAECIEGEQCCVDNLCEERPAMMSCPVAG